jgi:hypothetical protein
MGREARVKRDQPKSEPKRKRTVKIWTKEDMQRALVTFALARSAPEAPKTFTIETDPTDTL